MKETEAEWRHRLAGLSEHIRQLRKELRDAEKKHESLSSRLYESENETAPNRGSRSGAASPSRSGGSCRTMSGRTVALGIGRQSEPLPVSVGVPVSVTNLAPRSSSA